MQKQPDDEQLKRAQVAKHALLGLQLIGTGEVTKDEALQRLQKFEEIWDAYFYAPRPKTPPTCPTCGHAQEIQPEVIPDTQEDIPVQMMRQVVEAYKKREKQLRQEVLDLENQLTLHNKKHNNLNGTFLQL